MAIGESMISLTLEASVRSGQNTAFNIEGQGQPKPNHRETHRHTDRLTHGQAPVKQITIPVSHSIDVAQVPVG